MYYIYNLVSCLSVELYMRIFIKLVIVSIDKKKNVSTWLWRVSTFYSYIAIDHRYPSQSWQRSDEQNYRFFRRKFDKFLPRRVSSKTLDNFCPAGWSEFQQSVKRVQLMLTWNLPLSEYDRKGPCPWGS